MNTVNLPLALFTVVLRRFIDKLRTPQGIVVLKSAPWFIDTSLFKPCMYVYMFSAGLYYTLKHMQRGTIISLAQKCSNGAISIKDKCLRKKWLDRKKSWFVKNLMKNRDGQQKALRYVASLVSQDRPNQQTNAALNKNENITRRCQNNHQRVVTKHGPTFNNQVDHSFGSNPYFDARAPNSKIPTNRTKPLTQRLKLNTILKPKTNLKNPVQNTLMPLRPKQYEKGNGVGDSFKNFQCNINKRDTRNPTNEALHPIEELSDYINITDDTISDDLSKKLKMSEHKKKPRLRNCLTLRGRKINKNELNCDNKIVRKTRSGRIYGYQCGKSRYRRFKM